MRMTSAASHRDKTARGKVHAEQGNSKKNARAIPAKSRDPLAATCAKIEGKATPNVATIFTKKELLAGCVEEAAKRGDAAIQRLLSEKKLLRLQRGKTGFYLHAASVEALLGFSNRSQKPTRRRAAAAEKSGQLSEASAPQPSAPEFPIERVRAAYRELARETSFSDVLISELRTRADITLDLLKPWLLQESRAGRALPTRGDWSIADADARTAAIEIGGEPHLRVRFVER
jgi:hypothetical protein